MKFGKDLEGLKGRGESLPRIQSADEQQLPPGAKVGGLGLGEPNDVQPVGDDLRRCHRSFGVRRRRPAPRQPCGSPDAASPDGGRARPGRRGARAPPPNGTCPPRARGPRAWPTTRSRARSAGGRARRRARTRPTRAARPRGTTAEGRSARSRRCTGCRAAARPRAPTARSARCARGRARGPRARRRAGARRARGPGPARRRGRPRRTDRRARRARLSPQVQARASRAGTGASPEARPRSPVRTRARSPS